MKTETTKTENKEVKTTTPVVKTADTVKKAEIPAVKPVESVKKESTLVVKTAPITVTKEAAKTTEAPVAKPKKAGAKEIKTTPVTTNARTAVKPVQSYQSTVTTAANNDYGIQWISTSTAPKTASTALVKVTKTVDVLSALGGQELDQQVKAGSEFAVIASKYYNGNLYYEIGDGKWIMVKYTTQEVQITAKSDVLTINSKPDCSIPVWRVPDQDQIASELLKDGSGWRYFRIANIQGQTRYDLGGDQWVPARSVLVH